ncbi:hypothetical protein [Spirosoma aerophilum]
MDYSLYQPFSSYFPQFSRGIVKNFLLLAQALLASRSTNLNTVKDRIGTLLGKADRRPASHYKRPLRRSDDPLLPVPSSSTTNRVHPAAGADPDLRFGC